MTDTVQVTVKIQEEDLSDEALQEFTQELQPQLEEVEGVQDVSLVPDTEADNLPSTMTHKGFGAVLLGMLTIEISVENLRGLLHTLSDRMGGKTLEMGIRKPDGTELTIKVSNQKDFDYIRQQAEQFLRPSTSDSQSETDQP